MKPSLMRTAKYQNFKNVKNLGAAIHLMIEGANKEMDDAGFDNKEEWVTVSRMFGSAAVPQETSENMKVVFEKMKKEGSITDKDRWGALDLLATHYLEN